MGSTLTLSGRLSAHVGVLLRGAEGAGDGHDQHQPGREAQRTRGEPGSD